MMVMALDHVRDYFHYDAFLFSPTDLSQTNVVIFLTRWITHFCAPVFVFLAGTSAYLYGALRGRVQLSYFLLTRGAWLMIAECCIITLEWTFNPTYPFFNLAVIWVTGLSMVLMSVLVRLKRSTVLIIGVIIIVGHHLLDGIHVPGTGPGSFLWALLHEPGYFTFGSYSFTVRYTLLPWVGIMAAGYGIGGFYLPTYNAAKRRTTLLYLGVGAIVLFGILRMANWYGDTAHWSTQKSGLFSLLSFLNVSKYPPSLQYVLMTLGPALIFLSVAEKPLNKWTSVATIFGRVPMFYYLAHLFLIHILAIAAVIASGYEWSEMILTTNVNKTESLKGYGFHLMIVYLVWMTVIFILYPFCKWFDRYKRANQSTKWWLSYL